MLLLKAEFLEARELPAKDPYPPSCIVSVLRGNETRNLMGKHELLTQLEGVERYAEVWLELNDKALRLEEFGGSGRGNAYRLSVVRLVDPREAESELSRRTGCRADPAREARPSAAPSAGEGDGIRGARRDVHGPRPTRPERASGTT